MKKQEFVNYIKRYNLNGTIEQAKTEIFNNEITTTFISQDKTLVGKTKQSNITIQNCSIPVYETSKLLKLLTVFGDEVEITADGEDGIFRNLNIKDKEYSAKFVLTDERVLGLTPKNITIPDIDVSIQLNSELVDKILTTMAALDVNYITFNNKSEDEVQVIVGYSQNNTTRLSFDIKAKVNNPITNISFNSNYIRNILNNNPFEGLIEISNKGLCIISYKTDTTENIYYLTQVQHI